MDASSFMSIMALTDFFIRRKIQDAKESELLLVCIFQGVDVYQPMQSIPVGSYIPSIDIDDSNQILAFTTYDPFFKVYKRSGTAFSKINQIDPGDDAEDIDVTPNGRFIFASAYGNTFPNKLMEYANASTGY